MQFPLPHMAEVSQGKCFLVLIYYMDFQLLGGKMKPERKNVLASAFLLLFFVSSSSLHCQAKESATRFKAISRSLFPTSGTTSAETDKLYTEEDAGESVPGEKLETGISVQQQLSEEKEELSSFQEYLINQKPLGVSREIDHFGRNFFKSPPETFSPAQAIPVNAGYVIGPGDEIRINVWGPVEGEWQLVVDRDGNIHIPSVGTSSVAGLTYEKLQPFIKNEISKYYRDFHLNVGMGRLRSIPVYIVGNVKKPGNYNISSLSTLVNALFVSGGPSTSGTMRDIQLKREGETIVRFDMYDFFLKGDKTKDVRLLPEDVIFVPPAGPMAALIGNVANPAIYELKGDITVNGLLEMAGGVSATGYLRRVQVERIFENETRILLDKNLKKLSEKDDILLLNGDVVVISSVPEKIANVVTLEGNVVSPGNYQWFEGMRVSDIIKDAEKDLLPETNFEYGLIERTLIPSYEKELIFFKPGKALLEKDMEEDKLLECYDTVEIYSRWQYEERPKVRITGAVASTGEHIFRENMKVSDLVKLAGGLKHFAYTREAELTRVNITPDGPETKRLYIDIEKALQEDPAHNIVLHYDDYLFIRTVPDWQLYETVRINGEVKFPGTYTIKKGETLTSLIGRAGGFTGEAYARGAVFTREDVRRTQREQMDKMIDQLEMDLLSPRTLPADATTADVQAQQAELERKRELVEKLKEIEPDGRIVISLAVEPGKKMYDMELQDGDILSIPKNPGIVSVLGAVYNPTTFVYDPNLNYRRYLEMAGGVTPTANRRELYIIKVDGTIFKPGRNYRLEPGDAVVAPENIEFVSLRREMKDIIDILYKTAITVAVTTTIF